MNEELSSLDFYTAVLSQQNLTESEINAIQQFYPTLELLLEANVVELLEENCKMDTSQVRNGRFQNQKNPSYNSTTIGASKSGRVLTINAICAIQSIIDEPVWELFQPQ